MNFDFTFRRFSITAFSIVMLSATAFGQADDPPGQPADGDSSDDVIREQSIYIPYSKLREIFEREGRGVFLPYEEFQELWRAARDKTLRPVGEKPPVEFLITDIESEATVSKDVVRVRATVRIELLGDGWHEIPLRLSDAAITKATLGDKSARIIFEPGGGHKLLVQKEGQQPEVLELSLEYAKSFSKTPGRNSVSFLAPQAPVNRWRIRIPEKGVKVNIHPLIAATEVSGEGQDANHSDYTVVLAFVGAAPAVRIDWTPKAEGAAGLEALAKVTSEHQVWIDEGVTRTRTSLVYEISRAALSQLTVEVPADERIINVSDHNVRQWSVEQAGDVQRIMIQLFEPAAQTQTITIELEKFTAGGQQKDVRIPVVRAVGASRQQGVVVTHVAKGFRAEAVKHTGLLQMDADELPESLAQSRWAFSYRYVAVPFDLTLRVDKIQPRIVVDSLVEATLEPQQLTIDLLAVYNVERQGVFRLELDIPKNFEIRSVRGRAAAAAQAVQVDTHYLEGEDKTHLVVNLGRRALGRVALYVQLRKQLKEPDLLDPTGHAADIALTLPQVTETSVERASGRLVVYAPESLRVNPSEVGGLRSISFAEAFAGLESARSQRFAGVRPVLAFAYGQEDVRLSLAAERRKPHITARQLLVAQIEAGVVRHQATFFYDILYSGVKSLRIDLPADVATEIANDTPGVRESIMDPAPEDLAEGYTAWRLVGETEFIGSIKVQLSWQRKIEQLDVGKSVQIKIPHLRPMAVDRAWGQIVLIKAETIDIREAGEPQGIRPIDPQHDLMTGADVEGAARAFEFHDQWELDITATRYKLEEVKRTSIERSVLRMVITRSDEISVQALYRMRSAQQRLALRLPANVQFDREPLRINGRPVALERGEGDDFFVPLVSLNADESFLLELRYTISRNGLQLDCPVFPSEPAVQKVYLCAYVPYEFVYLGSRGPWSDELHWRWVNLLDRKPFPNRSDAELVSWVSEGVNLRGNPAGTFQTDGRQYLFSALRPTAGPDGSLRLLVLDKNWLNILIFVPVFLGGLVLLRRKAATQWLTLGSLIAALIVMGVFFPTLSLQIVDGKLFAAISVVVVMWLLRHIVWVRPRDPEVAARKQARVEARLARIRAKAPQPAVKQTEPAASPTDPGGPKDAPSSGEKNNKNEGGGGDV